MDDAFRDSNLADALGSENEDEEEIVPKGYIRAPNVNRAQYRRDVTVKRVFVDSRDRDRTLYANANSFRTSLVVPLRGIRSITLTDLYVPIVAGHLYVAVVLRNLKDRTLMLTRESSGLPAGVLAIIPLIPATTGANYAYYGSVGNQKGVGSAWKVSFPQGMSQLDDLNIQLFAWSWNATQPLTIPYPMPADAALPNAPLIGSNITIGFEIEHDV